VGSGFRIQGKVGSGFRIQGTVGSGFRIQGTVGSGFRIQGTVGSGFRIQGTVGLGFRIQGTVGLGFRIQGTVGSGFRIQGTVVLTSNCSEEAHVAPRHGDGPGLPVRLFLELPNETRSSVIPRRKKTMNTATHVWRAHTVMYTLKMKKPVVNHPRALNTLSGFAV